MFTGQRVAWVFDEKPRKVYRCHPTAHATLRCSICRVALSVCVVALIRRVRPFSASGVGGLSRRLLSPAWLSWCSADAHLAKLCLWGRGPFRQPPPLEALEACFWGSKIKLIFGCVVEASPHAAEGFGHVFWASIISTIGPSFLISGHLNISRVLEGLEASYVWCQEANWGPKQAP